MRAAFTEVRRAHTNERFYAYVLYSEPLLGYVVPSCNSEEGLEAAGGDELRWSPPDWRYHGEGESHFKRAQALLDKIHASGADESEQEGVREAVWAVFISALKRLDVQGFFGTGKERDRVLVNIMWGDQNVPIHIGSAEKLNPRASFLAYAEHELPALRSHVREFKQAKDEALLKRLETALGRA